MATDYHVTASGAGTNSGATWANAKSAAQFFTGIPSSAPGDRWFLMGGQTYTFTANVFVGNDGLATSPIEVIGVASGTTAEPPTSSDWAVGDDRPLLANGSYYFIMDNWARVRNTRHTGTSTSYLMKADYGFTLVNCQFISSAASGDAVQLGYRGRMIACEVSHPNGDAVAIGTGGGTVIEGCYIHDSTVGINGETNGEYCIIQNIIDTCVTGISLGATFSNSIIGCTIYGSTTGITGTSAYEVLVFNNKIDNCTTGASWTTEQGTNTFDYNNWTNNTTDATNVTKGPNATAVSPSWGDAANGDFSDSASVPGYPGAFPGGLTTGYLEMGAVQKAAGGGGGGLLRRLAKVTGA